MAHSHTCNKNCGCTNSYTVTAPCSPACPEVFNASCIVYTGPDILCGQDLVIKRYDYLDAIISKIINYLCDGFDNIPLTSVIGGPSGNSIVTSTTIGNVTTYSIDSKETIVAAGTNVTVTTSGGGAPAYDTTYTVNGKDTTLALAVGETNLILTSTVNPLTNTTAYVLSTNLNLTQKAVDTLNILAGGTVIFVHNLGTSYIIVSLVDSLFNSLQIGVDYDYIIDNNNQITIQNLTGAALNCRVTVIG